jgi:DNA modification methylase
MDRVQIINKDIFALTNEVVDNSIDCIVTSPPYYQQRDYLNDKQLGQEATPEAYVAKLVEAFAILKPKLRDDGTLWLNLGDKYKDGSQLGIPWMTVFALKASGWILRSDIIWHKPNAMPSSVKNRPTTDHEYLFLFSKSAKYHYDADAIREPHVTFSEQSKMRGGRNHFGKADGTPEAGKFAGLANLHRGRWDQAFHPKGRNKRTVWSISLGKYKGAHFAVFPEGLVEPCVLAGSRAGGTVLDPFMGSATTGVVALKHGRSFIGVEVNSDYIALAEERLAKAAPAETTLELPLLQQVANDIR